jgi:hypothetical protein
MNLKLRKPSNLEMFIASYATAAVKAGQLLLVSYTRTIECAFKKTPINFKENRLEYSSSSPKKLKINVVHCT